MGFLKDLSADISQAVEELIPKELLEGDSEVVVNTLDEEPAKVDAEIANDYENILNNLDNMDMQEVNTLDDDVVNLVNEVNEDEAIDNILQQLSEAEVAQEIKKLQEEDKLEQPSILDENQYIDQIPDDYDSLSAMETVDKVVEDSSLEYVDEIPKEIVEQTTTTEVEEITDEQVENILDQVPDNVEDQFKEMFAQFTDQGDIALNDNETPIDDYVDTLDSPEVVDSLDEVVASDIVADEVEAFDTVVDDTAMDNSAEAVVEEAIVEDAMIEDIVTKDEDVIQEEIPDEIEEAVGEIEAAVMDESIINVESEPVMTDNYLGGMLSEYMNLSSVKQTTVKEEEEWDMASQKNKKIDEIISSLEDIENGVVDDTAFDRTLNGKGSAFSKHDKNADIPATDEVSVITKGTTVGGGINASGSLEIYGNVNGDVECKGKLTILGNVTGSAVASEIFINTSRFEGDITSKGPVKIGVGTVVIGDVTGSSAVIAGAIKGEVDVTGPVILDSTAVVKGNVKGKSVQVNNGAVLQGFCSLAYADVDIDDFFEAEEFKK